MTDVALLSSAQVNRGHVLDPMSPSEQMLYCTVRIAGESKENRWTGTGFIVNTKVDGDQSVPLLITNRHVIGDADRITFRLHLSDETKGNVPSGTFALCEVMRQAVIYPDDDSVDLAAIPIAGLLNQLKEKGTPVFYVSVGMDAFPEDNEWREFDVLEDCVMVGCPNGLYDATNNFAIFRKGCTASSLAVDYDGREEFLIDIACFGGSSGSPIFTYNVATKFNRETKKFELGGRGLKFVGVLYAGPTYLQEGRVIMRTPVVNLRTTMHLGFAIKSTQVQLLVRKVLGQAGLREEVAQAA